MSGLNKVMLIGYLGQDPETRYVGSGDPVTNISIATSERWKDKQTGERKERTEWHRIVMWRRLAEIAAEYLRKGSHVYIEGKLQTRKWEDKDGITRYTTEIVANEMKMLGGKGDREERNEPSQPSPAASQPEPGTSDDFDDDIPF